MTESWTAEQHAAKAEELLLQPSSNLERSVTALAHMQIASFKAAAEAMKLTRGVMERQEQRADAMMRESGITVEESA